MGDWLTTVIAVITTIGLVISQLSNRRLAKAQSVESISSAWARLNGPLLDRVRDLEGREERLEARVERLEGENRALLEENIRLKAEVDRLPKKGRL
jgi:predicted RNase H-like nuclease (RuvC/YqgF family)